MNSVTPSPKKKDRTVLWVVLLVSVGVHVLAAVGAGLYIVAKWLKPPEATFIARKMVVVPPQIIDPKMASAELESAAPRPTLDEKMASLRETDFALPDLPQMPVEQVMDFNPSVALSDAATGLGDGMGAGDGGAGGGGESSGMNFFGIQTQAKSVVIVFDVSLSVLNKADKAGVPITRIQEETLKLVDGLSINTKFNLIQFSRYYQPMADAMQSPSDEGKARAKEWLGKEFRTNGSLPRSVRGVRSPQAGQDNGICFVLDAALAMKPDVIFLISDGSFQSEKYSGQVPWDEVDKLVEGYRDQGSLTKIHVIGFEMKSDDKKELKKIVRHTDGTLKEFGKD